MSTPVARGSLQRFAQAIRAGDSKRGMYPRAGSRPPLSRNDRSARGACPNAHAAPCWQPAACARLAPFKTTAELAEGRKSAEQGPAAVLGTPLARHRAAKRARNAAAAARGMIQPALPGIADPKMFFWNV